MNHNSNNFYQTAEQLKKELEETKHAYELLKTASEKASAKYSQTIVALQESESNSKNLFYNVPVNYHSLDDKGCILDANPAWLASLGFTHEEVAGHHFSEFITPEADELFKTKWLPALRKSGQIHDIEFEMIHKNGTCLFVSLDGKVGADSKGEARQLHFIWSDITRRKKAEKLQSENENSYRELFNNVTDAIYIQDEEGVFLDVNEGAVKMYGYPKDVLIGKTPLFVSAPGKNDLDAVAVIVKRAFDGEPQLFEFWGKRGNGEIFPKEVRIVNGTYFGKKVNIAIAQDITGRKQAEKALIESEERYRKLFEASPDAIILADIESGMLVGANSAACSMLGYELNEIRRMHQTQIHPARFEQFVTDAFTEHVQNALNNGNVQAIESFILRSDGTEIPVEVLSNNITLNGRNILQGVFRNISDRNQAREELLKAKEKAEANDKLKSAFLRNISHELRTPLNGIIGFSEMLTQSDSSEDDRIEFNRLIKKSSTRLINTITGYMDISLIVSGLTEVHKQPFSILKFLDKITSQTIELCYSRNLHLDVISKAPDRDVEIITDEFLLIKIFRHFIDNAVKFTKEGSITIGYELRSGYHQFSVSDTGTGIPEDFLSVIFDIFTQADPSASRVYEGSGLGLSIARGFVKLLGGEVRVESKINQGSKFIFTIPAEESVADYATRTSQSLQPILPVILVAEDDDSNYKYLEIVLKKASFKVLRAKNGFETVDICRRYPDIRVLITDMKMPGMDGMESTRLIRALLPDLPIIALSGLISSMDEEAARLAGCDDYIIKPVSKAKLLETIYRLIYLPGNAS